MQGRQEKRESEVERPAHPGREEKGRTDLKGRERRKIERGVPRDVLVSWFLFMFCPAADCAFGLLNGSFLPRTLQVKTRIARVCAFLESQSTLYVHLACLV